MTGAFVEQFGYFRDAPRNDSVITSAPPTFPKSHQPSSGVFLTADANKLAVPATPFWALAGIEWAFNSGQSWSLAVNGGQIKSLAIIGLSPNFLCSPNRYFMEPRTPLGPQNHRTLLNMPRQLTITCLHRRTDSSPQHRGIPLVRQSVVFGEARGFREHLMQQELDSRKYQILTIKGLQHFQSFFSRRQATNFVQCLDVVDVSFRT